MKKIRFTSGASSAFFRSLDRDVQRMIRLSSLKSNAKRCLWTKMVFYFILHFSSYVMLFLVAHPAFAGLLLNYIWVGISGILLAFNVAHDACHGTFHSKKSINHWLYHLSFNLQGTNAYLWKIRHISSHHVFPNVDGCDADIDDNPILRLSPQHRHRPFQRYQHIYAMLVYAVYTLHWFLIKDFFYLNSKEIGNLGYRKHPRSAWIFFFGWKVFYLFLLIVLPISLGNPVSWVIAGFLIMHVVNSLFFIHTLIGTHLCMETCFPKSDESGALPDDFYTHQLATSADYQPESRFLNFFLGGFNAHAAHHLYPRLPHTMYPYITRRIREKASQFKLPYHQLGFLECIRSHYTYLKIMGNPG